MRKLIKPLACAGAVFCLAISAQAQFNGLVTVQNAGGANTWTGSTRVIANSNTIPGTASISDSLYAPVSSYPSSGANRDDILLSEDNGSTAATLGINQPWSISTTFTLADGSDSPRKEAGIRINSPTQGDALFIVDSDAKEIVAFGAGAPFFSFGSGATGYTTGTPITLSETYTPAAGGTTGGNPGFLTYTVSYPTLGLSSSSGPLAYSNLEGGPVGYNVGVYAQTDGVANANDFLNANFASISATLPEPGSLTLLGLGAVSLMARRRRLT